jgi:hypothetical protein
MIARALELGMADIGIADRNSVAGWCVPAAFVPSRRGGAEEIDFRRSSAPGCVRRCDAGHHRLSGDAPRLGLQTRC